MAPRFTVQALLLTSVLLAAAHVSTATGNDEDTGTGDKRQGERHKGSKGKEPPVPVVHNLSWAYNDTFLQGFNSKKGAYKVQELKVRCGDTVQFKVAADRPHNVVLYKRSSYKSRKFPGVCEGTTTATLVPFAPAGARTASVILLANGEYHVKCGVGKHCEEGYMALIIRVVGVCPKTPLAIDWTFGTPTGLIAKQGDQVLFNKSSAVLPHNLKVSEEDTCTPKQSQLLQDTTFPVFQYTATLDKNGTFSYICDVVNPTTNRSHCPSMKHNAVVRPSYHTSKEGEHKDKNKDDTDDGHEHSKKRRDIRRKLLKLQRKVQRLMSKL